MKLIEKKFKRDSTNWGWCGVKFDGYLCQMAMVEYFSIPKCCREIWVSLHTIPAPNRLAMVVEDAGGGMMDLVEVAEDSSWGWGSNGLDDFLRLHIDETLYVQVEYMG